MNYYDFVKKYMGTDENLDNTKYSRVGHSFNLDTQKIKGVYWFYQTDEFIIDIHDFFIKKQIISNEIYNISNYISIYTCYLINAKGEKFSPYQTLSSNSLYSLDFDNMAKDFRFILHENSYYLSVSIGFKREVLERKLKALNIDSKTFYSEIFLSNQTILTKVLEPIAFDILNCKKKSLAAKFFFNAKVNEWLSVIIDTYLNKKNFNFFPDDEESLENVSKYLDDNFSKDISQNILEKISMMSGTKLKKLFKEKYGQTITEYTQRKRMKMAEMLLINTDIKIREIAKSVGYLSPSKFSTYYKRYMGIFPSEVRKMKKWNYIDF